MRMLGRQTKAQNYCQIHFYQPISFFQHSITNLIRMMELCELVVTPFDLISSRGRQNIQDGIIVVAHPSSARVIEAV